MSKRIILITTVFLLVGIGFNSCKKYEEGPSFSLLTATKRITGTWELKETQLNGQILEIDQMLSMFSSMEMDSMSGFEFDLSELSINSIKITFEKDGNGSFTFALSYMGFPVNQTENTTWAFDDKKDNIDITIMDEIQTFEILKLTNKELWLSRVETVDNLTNTIIMKLEKEE